MDNEVFAVSGAESPNTEECSAAAAAATAEKPGAAVTGRGETGGIDGWVLLPAAVCVTEVMGSEPENAAADGAEGVADGAE